MSGPAYQLQGNAYEDFGALGTSPLGTGPLGGNLHRPVPVPTVYLGSDDLRERERVDRAGPEHFRHGVLVDARTWAEVGRWNVVHRGLTATEVAALRSFWQARIFNLLPTGDVMGVAIPVIWKTREWNPKRIRGGRYELQYELEERP